MAVDLKKAKVAFAKLKGQYTPWMATNDNDQFFTLPKTTTNEDLKNVPSVPFPLELGLEGSRVTDAGLTNLRHLDSLTGLVLSRLQINGEGFVELKNLPKLYKLSLESAAITDGTMKHLASIPGLTTLLLPFTPITDAGLKELKDLCRSSRLWTSEGHLSRPPVWPLSKMSPRSPA